METPDKRAYQRTESDGSLNHHMQRERENTNPNLHQPKYNRNIGGKGNFGSSSSLDSYTSRSNNNLNEHRNYSRNNSSTSLNSYGANNGYRGERRNHNRSKSNVDVRHQQRKKGGSVEDYNRNHSRSKSNGQAVNNYRDRDRDKGKDRDRDRDRARERDRDRDRERRPERMNSDRSRGRNRNDNSSRDRDLNGSRNRERSRPRDNNSSPGKLNKSGSNSLNDLRNDNEHNIGSNELHRFPSSSSVTYKQKYQVNTSSPLSKPTQFIQDQRKPSVSSLKQSHPQQLPQQPSTSQLSKLRNISTNNISNSSLNNPCPMPTKSHLIKNDSSTSIFSEVSISSTVNNHYRFTGNINNNYIGGN